MNVEGGDTRLGCSVKYLEKENGSDLDLGIRRSSVNNHESRLRNLQKVSTILNSLIVLLVGNL